jgi:hypothetical protein
MSPRNIEIVSEEVKVSAVEGRTGSMYVSVKVSAVEGRTGLMYVSVTPSLFRTGPCIYGWKVQVEVPRRSVNIGR